MLQHQKKAKNYYLTHLFSLNASFQIQNKQKNKCTFHWGKDEFSSTYFKGKTVHTTSKCTIFDTKHKIAVNCKH